MSNQSPFARRGRAQFPTLPRGEVVGTFESYVEAQSAVDTLARADFPVNQLSIVGSDLKTVERVTGKLSWGRVALAGAASGAWLGVFFGLLLVIFSPATSMAFVIAAIMIGAGFGMLFGIVSYAINKRRRDFTSMTQVLASSYQVIVDPELANRARNLIGQDATHPKRAPANGSGFSPPAPHPSDPPPAPPAGQAQTPPADGEDPPTRPPHGPYGERIE